MKKIITFLILTSLVSCNKNDDKADGYGILKLTKLRFPRKATGIFNY